jgi:hypothetical protein
MIVFTQRFRCGLVRGWSSIKLVVWNPSGRGDRDRVVIVDTEAILGVRLSFAVPFLGAFELGSSANSSVERARLLGTKPVTGFADKGIVDVD